MAYTGYPSKSVDLMLGMGSSAFLSSYRVSGLSKFSAWVVECFVRETFLRKVLASINVVSCQRCIVWSNNV